MAATLDHVIGQLKDNKKSQQETTTAVNKGNTLLGNYLETLKANRLKDLEEQRESMKKLGAALAAQGGIGGAGGDKKKGGGALPDWAKMGLGGLGGALGGTILGRMLGALTRMITPILAGITALALASEGLRGWEAGAVLKLTEFAKKLPEDLKLGMTNFTTKMDEFIRNRLKGFDIDEFFRTEDGKKIQNRDGNKFAKGFQIKTTLEMFQEALVKAKNGIVSRILGVELDEFGKMKINIPQLDPSDVKAGDALADVLKGAETTADGGKVGKAFGTIVDAFGKITKPMIAIGDAIGSTFNTFLKTFAATSKFLGITALGKGIVNVGGSFLKLVTKLLWPIGLIFSGYEAVQDWLKNADNPDMTMGDRVVSAISAFVSDFIGAPLDLLKMGFSWLYKKIFGVETDENGKVLPNQGFRGLIAEKLDKFSFVEFIDNFIEGAWGFVKKVFEELTKFFTDPKKYVTDAYNNFLEKQGVEDLGGLLTKWVDDLFTTIAGFLPSISDLAEGFKKIIGALVPNWAREWFGLPPDPAIEQAIKEARESRGITDTMTDAQKSALGAFYNADKDGDKILTKDEIMSAMGSLRPFNPQSIVAGSFAAQMQRLYPNLFGSAGIPMNEEQSARFDRLIAALQQNGGGMNLVNASTNAMNSSPLVVSAGGTLDPLDPGANP